jgi:asparagine synthetase B (glutamine-hydrolysing)
MPRNTDAQSVCGAFLFWEVSKLTQDFDRKHTAEDLKRMQAWPLSRKIQVTQAKIIEWHELHNHKTAISFSGGVDSTVLLDLAKRCYDGATLGLSQAVTVLIQRKKHQNRYHFGRMTTYSVLLEIIKFPTQVYTAILWRTKKAN